MASLLERYKNILTPKNLSNAVGNAAQATFNPRSQQFQQQTQKAQATPINQNLSKKFYDYFNERPILAQGTEGFLKAPRQVMGFAMGRQNIPQNLITDKEAVGTKQKVARIGGEFAGATPYYILGSHIAGAIPAIAKASQAAKTIPKVGGLLSKSIQFGASDLFLDPVLTDEKNRLKAAGEGAVFNTALAGIPYAGGLLVGNKGALKGSGKAIGEMTGDFSNVLDKQARREISDYMSKIKPSEWKSLQRGFAEMPDFPQFTTLDNLFSHKPLFRNYPELKNLKVEFDPNYKATSIQGSFDPQTFTIKLNPTIQSADEAKSTLLHEIQHTIQQIEGFPKGDRVRALDPKIVDHVERQKEELMTMLSQTQDKTRRKLIAKNLMELDDQIKEVEQANWLDYQKNSAELEARSIQARKDLTQAERIGTDPYAQTLRNEGLNPQDLIVKYNGDESLSRIRNSVGDFVKSAFSGKENKVLKMMKAQPETIRVAKEGYGVDVSEYTHDIDTFGVRHALNRHSSKNSNLFKGEMPLTKEDISLVPDIIVGADEIVPTLKKTGTGNNALKYTFKKRLGNVVYYVEEIQTGNKSLRFKTMYKTKVSGIDVPTNAVPSSRPSPSLESTKPETSNSISPEMFSVNSSKPKVDFNDIKKVKQTFRTDKFDITDQEAKTLIKTLKKLGLDERNIRSFDEMKSMAVEILGDPKKALQGIQSGRIKDSEIIALGDIISTSTDRIATLTKKLKVKPTDLKLQQALDKEETILNQALGKRLAGGTEAGRAIVAFRILANKTLDPVYWLSKAQKQLGESRTLKAEEVDAINNLIKSQDRLGLAHFVSLLGESSAREKAVSLWKAGLLTSFRTHEANIIANTAFGALETIKDIPATGFDIARSAITGNPRAKSIGTITGSETLKGAKRGAKQAAQYFKEGVDPRDANKFENFRNIRYGDTKGGRLAQKYVDFVFRTLGAEDKVYREASFNRSIADQVMTLSKNEQMSAGKMSKLLTDPSPEMVDLAIKDAEYATFNNANRISDAVKRAKSGDSRIAATMDVVFPFVRTPTNVLLRAVDYTPAGILGTTIKKIVKGAEVSDRELADAFGRSATGMSILVAGYILASQGRIQGATPVKEAERSQMYLEGRQPNSMLINGKWVQISKISPVANLLVMGAAFHDAEGNVAQKTYQAGLAGTKALAEQSFLKGASGAISAVADPEQGGKKYVESAVGGMIPNFVKDIARGTEDVMRAKDTAVDSLVAGIPGLSQSLPVKVDALGNPIAQPDLLTAMFNPFNPKEANNDPLVREFARVGYNLNTVGDAIGNQKLTPEQQRAYQRLAGAKIRELTIPLIQSDAYQSLDVDQQQTVIDKAVSKAKAMAREEIKPQLASIEKGSDRGFKANATENEPSGKTRGGEMLIKRDADIGKWDMGNTGTQLDHKTALALYGNNKRSNQMILTVEENQQKGQVETYLKNEVDKGNITLKEAKKREKNWREEYSAMKPKESTKTTGKTGTSVIIDPSTTKTIDYAEFTKPNQRTGIDAYKYEQDKISTAKRVYNSDADQTVRQKAIESMGLKYDDVEYDYIASQNNDVKYQYLMGILPKTTNKDDLLKALIEARKKSLSGEYLLSSGIITDMVDAGLITKAEGKSLKAFELGGSKPKKSSSKKKKKVKAIKIEMPKSKRVARAKKARRKPKYTPDYIKKALGVNTKALSVNSKSLLSS